MNNGKMKIENRISINFNELIEDCTKDGKKIPKNDYLAEGRFPIIDQGQEFIAGYSNDDSEIYSDVPAIIFGDHTRVFKYIDFPFFLGADGVKLLKAKQNVSYKYLYYFFSQAQFPNTGYARHFKWLKELQIPLPPIETQKQIAATLDKVTRIIAENKKLLEKYDLLIKSRFIEMFGDTVENPKQWIIEKLKSLTSKIGSGATPKGGRESYISEGISLVRSMNVYNGFFEYEGLAHITEAQAKELDNVTLQENDVLLNITGASVARCCILPKDVLPARVNQHVSILRTTEKLNPVYLSNLLISDTEQRVLLGIGGAGGATREAITKTELESLDIPVPPLELQQQFAAFVQQIDKSKFAVQKSLEKAETLYKSLMQEYFG